jgi:lycopene epsilon-cyclase
MCLSLDSELSVAHLNIICLHWLLTELKPSRCFEAGVTYLNSKVDKIVESPDGHRVVCCERGREILCRLAIVASGAASGRLLEYEVGGPRVCVQTAYGVEVEVHID